MTEAEKLFNEAFARWLYASSVIFNFRSTFTNIAASAGAHLEAKTTELMRSLFEDPQWKGLLQDIPTAEPAAPRPPVDYRSLGSVAAQGIMESSYASLDAATLVFYHSLLDALIFDCCNVTALHAPADWEPELKNAQVQLVDTKTKPYDQLFKAKLSERLEKLGKESLLFKIDRLFARCSPPARWSPMDGYEFDRKYIERFDEQRHRIVHGEALGKPLTLFQVTDESLRYIQQTGMYFIGLLNFRYRLQIDPQDWSRAMQARSGSR